MAHDGVLVESLPVGKKVVERERKDKSRKTVFMWIKVRTRWTFPAVVLGVKVHCTTQRELRGGSDVGFSSCTAPYYQLLVSKYFGFVPIVPSGSGWVGRDPGVRKLSRTEHSPKR